LSKAGDVLVVNNPRVSDMIVVLAGETDRRSALAESLLEHSSARHVVLDVPANATIYNVSQMEIARRYADGLIEGRDWSVCPIEGLSTKDEVRDARSA
jgi:3-dehydroquinate synthase class II